MQLYSYYSANNRAVLSSVTDCFLFPVVPISNEYEVIKFQYRMWCYVRSLVALKSTNQTTAETITPSIIKETFVTVTLMNTDSFMTYSVVNSIRRIYGRGKQKNAGG